MSSQTVVLPMFNDVSLSEVKQYMSNPSKDLDYLYDDESLNTPVEMILSKPEISIN